ncbi:hypothetical protein JL722_12961 [Aureococcus anophagefferens]|nr:hypothetical protein JL722_12961 [Aureococcus anophagefferens]
MFDSGLDGWTDAFFSLYSESGDRVFHATLDAGATGTERFCLADGCYAASVNGDGLFPEEVSWTLGAVTGGAPTEMSMLFSGGDVQESTEACWGNTHRFRESRLGSLDTALDAAFAFEDVDGDGDVDAVVATDGSMFYLRNDGGEFVWKPLEEMRVGARTRPALGDVDGDADVDLVLGTGRIDYLENARGKFVNMTGRANPFAGVDVGGNHPALVDLDADGRLDLVCGGTDGALRRYTRGDGFFFAPDSSDWFASINEGDDSAPSFADFDGDGDADLVLGGSDGALFYYESQGTPVEPRFVNVLESPFLGFAVSSHSRPVAADVDGDGYVDLVVGSSGGATFLKNYDSRFDPNFQDLAGAQSPFSSVTFDLDSNDDREYSKPAVGDLNGDGLPDVVVGTKTGHVIALSEHRRVGLRARAAPRRRRREHASPRSATSTPTATWISSSGRRTDDSSSFATRT